MRKRAKRKFVREKSLKMDDTNISSTKIRSDLYIPHAAFLFFCQIQLPVVCVWHCLCLRSRQSRHRRHSCCFILFSVFRFYRLLARFGHVRYTNGSFNKHFGNVSSSLKWFTSFVCLCTESKSVDVCLLHLTTPCITVVIIKCLIISC